MNNTSHFALDAIDEQLLEQLQRNSQFPAAMLAEVARISETECIERIARLERTGYILGYSIVRGYPDPLTRPRVAVMRIYKHPLRSGHDLLHSLLQVPEIVSYDLLEADESLVLRLIVSDDARLNEIRRFFLVQASVTLVETSMAIPTIDLRRNTWLSTTSDS